MKYLIIGLGIYGANLALDLSAMGHEVIGSDQRRENIDSIKDYISTVYQIDSTDENALAVLPLTKVDIVIVAIGENFGASVRTVALLKKFGVRHIYARAIDKLHQSILEGFEIDRILTPEQRAAADLTHEMALGSRVRSLRIDDENYILNFKIPAEYTGELYSSLKFDDFGLKLIAVTRPVTKTNIMGVKRPVQSMFDFGQHDARIEADDVLTVLGSSGSYKSFYQSLPDVSL